MLNNTVFKASVNTKKWVKATAVRAIKTMAQVAGTLLVIGAFNETAWTVLIQTTLVSGLASVFTSLAGIPEVTSEEEQDVSSKYL